jgi:preprotein translocase subunit SecG|tara:strand:- start:126 stop:458 length:333 start_codon:yes stop_codon:yes gene_type:complete
MSVLLTSLLVFQVLLALLLVGIILLQQGKGATAGAGFGAGASATVFGSQGSSSFLTRTTAILAALFLSNSLFLAYLYGGTTRQGSLLDQISVQVPAERAAVDTSSPVIPD